MHAGTGALDLESTKGNLLPSLLLLVSFELVLGVEGRVSPAPLPSGADRREGHTSVCSENRGGSRWSRGTIGGEVTDGI